MTTENNPAAQASDEPMLPEPRAIRAGNSFPKFYALAYTADQMREFYQAGVAAGAATPRATAEVEKDAARWQTFARHCEKAHVKFGLQNDIRMVTFTLRRVTDTSPSHRTKLSALLDKIAAIETTK